MLTGRLFGRTAVDVLAVESGCAPALGVSKPAIILQQRGLAAAGRAEQREELVAPHVEIDAIDGGDACRSAWQGRSTFRSASVTRPTLLARQALAERRGGRR